MRAILLAAALSAALSTPVMAAILEKVEAFVAEVTDALPDLFDTNDQISGDDVFTAPLPGDVMAYARWFWTVDNLEGACQYLGQRSNIEVLDLDNGVQTRLVGPTMCDSHPDHSEYMRIFDLIDGAGEELGEDVLCPAMYKLLGPNGSLISKAVKINGLIDPEQLLKYEVRIQDGVLWSSKDYCARRFYLESPADEAWHKSVCAEAEKQSF